MNQPVEQLVVVEAVTCRMTPLSPPVDEPDEAQASLNAPPERRRHASSML